MKRNDLPWEGLYNATNVKVTKDEQKDRNDESASRNWDLFTQPCMRLWLIVHSAMDSAHQF